jgi:glycosyltransferase involved in cell wall biosynthesis
MSDYVAQRADVTVIIPLHDRRDLIGDTLRSLESAHHPGVAIETIVVDDGSTDGGDALVEASFPRVRLVRQARAGAPAARNRGLERATAETVLLLDSDDLIEPGFFAPRLAALRREPTAAGAYGTWEHFVPDGDGGIRIVPRHTPYPLEYGVAWRSHLLRLLSGWYIPCHAILWRAEALRGVGGQDVTLSVNQDVDLLFRILHRRGGIVACDAPRALYREHTGSRQGQLLVDRDRARDALALRERIVAALSATRDLDAQARRTLARSTFDLWRQLRRVAPESARGFLDLSRRLDPGLPMTARLPIRILAKLVGSARAAIVEDVLRERVSRARVAS